MIGVILAHGSNIDDVAWFAVPALIAILVLRRAEKRARNRAVDADEGLEPSVDAEDRNDG